jgi:hypothetical protein
VPVVPVLRSTLNMAVPAALSTQFSVSVAALAAVAATMALQTIIAAMTVRLDKLRQNSLRSTSRLLVHEKTCVSANPLWLIETRGSRTSGAR